MPLRTLIAGVLAALCFAAHVQGEFVTLEFEGVAPSGGEIFNTPLPYVEDGLSVTLNQPSAFHGFVDGTSPTRNTNGTDGFVVSNARVLQVTPVTAGTTFDFLSFGAVDLNPTGAFGPGFHVLHVTGYLSGGGTVSANFTMVNDSFLTFALPAQFVGLNRVDIQNGHSLDTVFDNLRFDMHATPEPGALTLAGLGVASFVAAAIGRRRREKTTAA